MPFPPSAILPGTLPEFRIYIKSGKDRFVLWAKEGNRVSPAQLARLTESGMNEVFIDIDQKFKYEQYLESNLGKILENKWSTDDQKAEIFTRVSTSVVQNAFETALGMGSLDANTLQRTEAMARNALVFIKESKSIHALSKMIGHDYQTYEHAIKVMWLTVAFINNDIQIAQRIHPDFQASNAAQRTEIMEQCAVGALLHDIGKAFVSREIIYKDGPLSEIEWEIMRRHPLSGLAMLLESELPVFVKKAIVQHHEDFHGNGYPMGLTGKNIDLLARVLRIIDTFDAMTSKRPYKAPLPPRTVIKIMIGSSDDSVSSPETDNRDLGMKRCFDEELLRKFVLFLGDVKLP